MSSVRLSSRTGMYNSYHHFWGGASFVFPERVRAFEFQNDGLLEAFLSLILQVLVQTRLIPGYLMGSSWTASTAAFTCSGVASTFHFTWMIWITVDGACAQGCGGSQAKVQKHQNNRAHLSSVTFGNSDGTTSVKDGKERRMQFGVRLMALGLASFLLAGCDELARGDSWDRYRGKTFTTVIL